MTTFFLCALLLSNVFMVGLLLVKTPQTPKEVKDEDRPSEAVDSAEEEDNDIVKIVKVAVKEAVPEVLKVMGRFCDADPADIEETVDTSDKHPAVVPNEKLDEVFTHSAVTAYDLGDEEPEVLAPKAEGLDFEAMQKTVDVLKGKSDSEADVEVAKRTLPDMAGTEIIERIALDPIVRKRILMIECQLPVMLFEPETGDNSEDKKPVKKIVFHADIDTTGVDGIDFNIYR